MKEKVLTFWKSRSDKYNNLQWVHDDEYLQAIIDAGEFTENDIVLDIGTGTGKLARAIRPLVSSVFVMDISREMLSKGQWDDGFSIIEWDAQKKIFNDNVFDKITARMVLHHILALDDTIHHCYDTLKNGGFFLIAEGVPPSDDSEIVEWYTNMFKLKEMRLTFSEKFLTKKLYASGFKNVSCNEHTIKNFSVRNWLENANLSSSTQDEIYNFHISANKKIKDAYKMNIKNNDCFLEVKNIIIKGTK